MGVMSCYRKDCENIMCDTYIDEIGYTGYICNDCQNEFKSKLNKTFGTQVLRGIHMREQLIDFMNTPKLSFSGNDDWIDADKLFNKL